MDTSNDSRMVRWSTTATILAGILASCLSLVVLAAWHVGDARVIQVFPGLVPMQYNTAIGFLLLGGALICAATNHSRAAIAPAGLVLVLATVTLSQYLFDWDAGIDELIFDHHITVETSHPGRMAPNTAFSFVLAALGIIAGVVAGTRRGKEALWNATTYLGTGVLLISGTALIGYLEGIEHAYGWGEFTSMALHTSLALIVIGSGLLAFALPSTKIGVHGSPLQSALFVGATMLVLSVLTWSAFTSTSSSRVWPIVSLVFNVGGAGLLAFVIYLFQTGRIRQRRLQEEVQKRLAAEQSLGEKSALLDAILGSMAEGVVAVDEKGKCLVFNSSAEEILGTVAKNIAPEDWPTVFGIYLRNKEDLLPAHRFPLLQAMKGERVRNCEVYQIHDGAEEGKYLSMSGAPLTGDQGQRVGGVVTFHDITAQKLAHEELERKEDRYLRAVSGTTDGLWDWEIKTGKVWFAPRFEQLLGYQPGELTQAFDTYETRWHPEDHARTMAALQQHLEDASVFDVEHRLMTRSGQYRWFRARGAVTRDAEGRPDRMAGSIQDIDDLKIAQQEVEEKNKQLARVNEELEQFSYTVSHDLKSPLITINGFLGMLERDLEDGAIASVHARIDRIKAASHRMQQLLDDLLELSRVGKIASQPVDIPFSQIVDDALEACAGSIEEHGLEVRLDPVLPVVHCDPVRMREVLQNLVENAIKFMAPQTRPVLEIGSHHPEGGRDGDELMLQLFVRDNGIGIEPQYAERVFNSFEQLSRQSAGTGIGLTLVKRVVEFHGGKVWIESAGEGQGCTICFTLPPGKSSVPTNASERRCDSLSRTQSAVVATTNVLR